MNFEDYFSFQIFFIFLRETLEIVVIISILLTIVRQGLSVDSGSQNTTGLENEVENENNSLTVSKTNTASPVSTTVETSENQPLTFEEEEEVFEHPREFTPSVIANDEHIDNFKLYKKLRIQIISGGMFGLVLCMLIGGTFIAIFYHIGTDLWSVSEHYYEGILSIIASVIISVMGLFFLRMGKLREKFRVKLASMIYSEHGNLLERQAVNDSKNVVNFSEKYAFFILPFITTLREGLEAVVFVGGVGIDQPLSSIPLSMACATFISGIFGVFFFKYSSSLSLKICLVVATCFLYLISAGLFSKGVWQLELQDYVNKCNGQDMSEVGSGPGSYDITRSVWHVNCCNGETDGGWMILTALFGWTNSATYGSVISYNIYWLVLILIIKLLMIEEQKGYIPGIPIKWQMKRIKKRMGIAKASIDLRSNIPSVTSSEPNSANAPSQRKSNDSKTPLISRE
ncbi:hypothetical protein TPHA_0L01570 [Tetrapisispora phaffii CBS 4417]|uniref:Iron transporter FTH1 n=1 Tax=Tetrapisispora phaffii (strain ATCC 24235 / CBS 4417 / NBRC 1672 / NRRL Y-8282 / UCD 70-5) TaxID=1071381 RepID=G8C032_TETPH|nr:hypothetical protein TPHA_0L01570 [Tetrapisispora phaffii CBS 4417]CCE65510.1 hypothetical protein TPHA_0L01570 [Tetrapisispora phaffii CBS 4417]